MTLSQLAPRRAFRAVFSLLSLAVAGLPPPAGAAPAEVLGLEQVASANSGAQAIAFDGAGNSMVASITSDVVVRRFDSRGAPRGDDIVLTGAGASSGIVDVAADAAGNFVVVWDRGVYSGGYVRAQLFDADGAARGAAFQVGAKAVGDDVNSQAQVAMAANGSFVVTWRHETYDPNLPGSVYSVQAQRFAADGRALGAELTVASLGGGYHAPVPYPQIAMGATRNFVISWAQPSERQRDIAFARYSAAGERLGDGIASDDRSVSRDNFSLGMDASDNLVALWRELDPGPIFNLAARRLAADGTPRGDVFRVNLGNGRGYRGRLAVAANGDFLVAWVAYECGCGQEPLFINRYAATGETLQPETRLNDQPAGFYADAAFDRNGQAAVVWSTTWGQSYLRRIGHRPLPVALGDLDADHTPDLTLVQTHGGARDAAVRSGATGLPLATVALRADFSAVDAVALPDADGNGAQELAVLGQQRSSGRIEVEIRDAASGAAGPGIGFLSRDAELSRHYEAVALGPLPGTSQLAVLAGLPQGGGRFEVRDASTGALLKASAILGRPYRPQALAALPDYSGNGAAEVVALGRSGTGRLQLEVRDSASGAVLNTLYPLSKSYVPTGIAVLPDRNGNGAREIAVLGKSRDTGEIRLVVLDGAIADGQPGSQLRSMSFLDANFSADALALVRDLNGNGSPELAVVGRNGLGNVVVEVRDSKSTSVVSSIAYTLDGFAPEGLDVSANRTPQISVAAVGAGLRTQTRDALTGALVSESSD